MEYIAHLNKTTDRTQSVSTHLTETAQLAQMFANKIGLGTCGYLMGLLHDLGKYLDLFQKRIKENGDKCDHATVGARGLKRIRIVSNRCHPVAPHAGAWIETKV